MIDHETIKQSLTQATDHDLNQLFFCSIHTLQAAAVATTEEKKKQQMYL